MKPEELNTSVFPTWCPGCGDYGIWAALKKALSKLDTPIENVVIVYGIGCSGNMASFLKVYGVHGLHGRAIPVAEGIKLANKKLKVIVVGGDGDLLGEGVAHLVAASRSNPDITVILHNNQIYGLTTGQSSPTSLKGSKSKTYPMGTPDEPLNPVQLALTLGASQVMRGFAGDIEHLTTLISDAINHEGFSLVEVLQPCVTFNKINTYAWFRERIKKLEQPERSRLEALRKGVWTNQQIMIGEFFRESKPVLGYSYGVLENKNLLELKRKREMNKLFESFR
ncbi:MAG: 2-oxoglutarate oxidoreductase subunit KorB [Microgenomates group bacterium ADurb.Bin238]|jgi:2-oxoglutarate ferredoxin oxidoreductase subunit beta|nr:MAG: 2-oxoglutarate oxidoreductase subunit KorB [Microgenomates group bacterium ADurb.Bin238]